MQSTINKRKRERTQPLPQPKIPTEKNINKMSLRETIQHIKNIPGRPISVNQNRDINLQNLRISFVYVNF